MEFATHESLKIKIDNYSGPLEVLLDLASEYLLMATWLAYLKSKLLVFKRF